MRKVVFPLPDDDQNPILCNILAGHHTMVSSSGKASLPAILPRKEQDLVE
jgi:hypothetical protein